MLEVKELWIYTNNFPILREVSFSIKERDTLVVLGESGSGKSTLGLFLAGILKEGLKADGHIVYKGKKIFPPRETSWRGTKAGIILQDPYQFFDPRMRIINFLAEGIRYHFKVSKKEARERAISYLLKTRFPLAFAANYPHQLSGGMLQRAAIAAVLSLEPDIVIADEPTSALDSPLRFSLLRLFKELVGARKTLIYITHSLEEAAALGGKFLVLYAGFILEISKKSYPFKPLHPYSKLLFACEVKRGKPLRAFEGFVPHPSEVGDGCPFYPRCPERNSLCLKLPPLFDRSTSKVRCWHVAES